MINFNEEDLRTYLDEGDKGPVVMLNLLRFAADGAAKYAAYVQKFESSGLNDRYGVELMYGGTGTTSLIGESGQAWDLIALVRYPSRQHFVNMVRDPLYQEFEHLRTEALVEAVLQPTAPVAQP